MFKNPNDPENLMIKSKIKEWLNLYVNIAENDVLNILEIPCWEPNCPDYNTEITYLKGSEKLNIIIKKPLVFIRKIDIYALTKQ